MSNQALFGFIRELQQPAAKYHRLALSREIANHLFVKSTLGTSSGELTEEDMNHILARFMIVLQTLNGKPLQPPSMTQPSPAGPEAYAPKRMVEEVERILTESR